MKIVKIDHNSPLFKSAVDVRNAVWPNYSESEEELKHFDKNYDPKYFFQRFVAIYEEEIIGSGMICEPWWSYKPGKLYYEINVLKEHRNKGIGSFCLEYVENILDEKRGYKLNTYSKEDYEDGINFLENRGYKVVLREPGSKLTIEKFDFSKFKNIDDKIKSNGIKICSLSELQKNDGKWQTSLYELYANIMKDVPNNDEMTERTFENFKNHKLNAPGFDAGAFFVAIDDKKYIGLSSLLIQKNKPQEYWTDLTGVLRSHRRNGIALALKVKTIKYVKNSNGISIETDNEENNPMFGINKFLGFVPLPAWLTYEKYYK